MARKKPLRQPLPPKDALPAKAAALKQVLLLTISGMIVFTMLFVRIRLLGIPLERDEGEYAYTAMTILNGYAPFEAAYNMKYPGTALIYAIFIKLFGAHISSIHTGLLLINVLGAFLVYALARKYLNAWPSAVAALAYLVMTVSPALMGFAAHATHFVVAFALGGILVLNSSARSSSALWRLLVGGFLLGCCILMKQPGLMFAFFGTGYHLWERRAVQHKPFKKIFPEFMLITAGILAPLALLFIWIYASGVFEKFWFWTFTYGMQYAKGAGWQNGMEMLRFFLESTWSQTGPLWLLFAAGLFCLFLPSVSGRLKVFAGGLFFFSALSVVPGLYFRGHYFVLLAPALCLLAGTATHTIIGLLEKKRTGSEPAVTAAMLIVLASCLFLMRGYLFRYTPAQISRAIYTTNPFIESPAIGEYLRRNTKPDDRIAVLGSEPQILFYANRFSATGYLYTYSLMEDQPYNLEMQEAMIGEIEAAKPAYVVVVRNALSWFQQPESPQRIFEWSQQYIGKNCHLVGAVALPKGMERSVYYWDEDLRNFKLPPGDYILIFRNRKRMQD